MSHTIASLADPSAVSPARREHDRRAEAMGAVDTAGLDALRASPVARELWAVTEATDARVRAIRRDTQFTPQAKAEKIAALHTTLRNKMEAIGEKFAEHIRAVESKIHRELGASLDSEGHSDAARHAAVLGVLQWPNRAPMDAIAHLEELATSGDAVSLTELRATLPLAIKDSQYTRRFAGTPNGPLLTAISRGQAAAVTNAELGREYAAQEIGKLRSAASTYAGMLLEHGVDMTSLDTSGIQMLLSPFTGVS